MIEIIEVILTSVQAQATSEATKTIPSIKAIAKTSSVESIAPKSSKTVAQAEAVGSLKSLPCLLLLLFGRVGMSHDRGDDCDEDEEGNDVFGHFEVEVYTSSLKNWRKSVNC